jgi:hypothetical protein
MHVSVRESSCLCSVNEARIAQAYINFLYEFQYNEAYPGLDLRTVAAKVADQSREKSRKVAESRGRSQNKEKRYRVNQSFRSLAIFLIKSRNVANQSCGKSRKIAQGRAMSHATLATFRSRIGL